MKKTLAILLALALVLCMMPSAAFATDITVDSGDTVELQIDPIADQTYCGTAIEPDVVVKAVVKNGDTIKSTTPLVKDTDYTVSYSNNTNAGEASVTVKGVTTNTNLNEKTATAKFTIKPFSFAEKKITFRVDNQVTGSTPITIDSLKTNNAIHYYIDGKEDNSRKTSSKNNSERGI